MLNIRTVVLAAGLCAVTAVGAEPASAQTTIPCQSAGAFTTCPVATGGSVRLQQTLTSARCEYGRTWGFDWNAVWVDRGCGGLFLVNGSGSGWQSGNWGQRVRCESENGAFMICQLPTYGYVRLVKQLSPAPCIAGNTWGYQADQIWVGNGCRGEFEVGYGDASWQGDLRVISCQSNDGRYSRCFTRTDGQVTLVRQLSSTPCVLQRNWGYDLNGVWVNDGCRGEFAVGHGGTGSGWTGYPGTWGGSGDILQQARTECYNKARGRAYQNVSITSLNQRGSLVWVYMRGYRSTGQFLLGCQYDAFSNRAQITSEDPAGGTGTLLQRGREVCTNRARSSGYQNIVVTSARQSGAYAYVELNARSQNRNWALKCTYRSSNDTAMITDQREVTGGGGGDVFADARNACESRAQQLGFQVTGSGRAQQEPWGVKLDLDLRKGVLQYSNGYCSYITKSRSATVVPGSPDR